MVISISQSKDFEDLIFVTSQIKAIMKFRGLVLKEQFQYQVVNLNDGMRFVSPIITKMLLENNIENHSVNTVITNVI